MPWDWGTDRKRDRERVCVLISRNIRGNKGFINDSSQYDDSIQNLQIQHISMLCCFFPICLAIVQCCCFMCGGREGDHINLFG